MVVGNGLSIEAATEIEAWLRVMQRRLEADVLAGTVPVFMLADWDRWAAQTRSAFGLPAPGVEPVTGQA